jgi:hypothetical protein
MQTGIIRIDISGILGITGIIRIHKNRDQGLQHRFSRVRDAWAKALKLFPVMMQIHRFECVTANMYMHVNAVARGAPEESRVLRLWVMLLSCL